MKTYAQLWQSLTAVYDESEAHAVVDMVMDVAFGMSKADILCYGTSRMSSAERENLDAMMQRLRSGEPVQYVLGEADFCGRRMKVRPSVLIPRPETAELCRWICEESATEVLDIGTGSGCIAITIAAEKPDAKVVAWDISDVALSVARENSALNNVEIDVQKQDALNAPSDVSRWDVIVSNPPYVMHREAESMQPNVLLHEPKEALFVPDDDALLFYRAIAQYSQHALRENGRLFFEINPLCCSELRDMLCQMGFSCVEFRDDMFGKTRFVRAQKRGKDVQK